MLLRIAILSAGLMSHPAAMACSLTPMGASTVQLEGVLKHVGKQYSGQFTSSISSITTVKFNRFVVTVADTKTGQLRDHKYLVSIEADCSTKVTETGP